MRISIRLSGTIAFLFLAACSNSGICEPDSLQQTLDNSAPGEVVRAGNCQIEGSFRVPEGVTLRGGGTQTTLIVGQLEILGGSAERLSVESDAGYGIVAEGEIELRDLFVQVTAGVGVLVDGGEHVTIEDVRVEGPMSRETASELPSMAPLDQEGTAGIVIRNVGSTTTPAVVTRADVSKVGPWGFLVFNSVVRLIEGSVHDVVGTGMLVQGGEINLEGTAFENLFQGIQALPAYAAVFTQGAEVRSLAVAARASEGVGFLHDNARGIHSGLVLETHDQGGLWVQNTTEFELSGMPSTLDGNGLSGIVVSQSSNVTIEDTTVANTSPRLAIVGESTGVEAADGIQLLGGTSIRLDRVSLTNNARVGLLVDLAGQDISDLSVVATTVSASGTSLGAIAQDGMSLIESGTWDEDITRMGSSSANDAARRDPLGTIGSVQTALVPALDANLF